MRHPVLKKRSRVKRNPNNNVAVKYYTVRAFLNLQSLEIMDKQPVFSWCDGGCGGEGTNWARERENRERNWPACKYVQSVRKQPCQGWGGRSLGLASLVPAVYRGRSQDLPILTHPVSSLYPASGCGLLDGGRQSRAAWQRCRFVRCFCTKLSKADSCTNVVYIAHIRDKCREVSLFLPPSPRSRKM